MNAHLSIRHAALLLGLTATLLGNPTPVIVDLAPWSVLGADKIGLAKSDPVNLPAGAQLYRVVTGSSITLTVESSPEFGQTAAELSVIELGDAALAFLGSGATGKLVLVLGDNPVLSLPYEIALDNAGRSAESLKVTLSREGATVAVTVRGQTLQFPAGHSAKPQEVVLSSGTNRSWTIQGLVLDITTEQPSLNGNADQNDASQSRTDLDRFRQQFTAKGVTGDGPGGDASYASGEKSGKVSATADSPTRPIFEIFTPPSVRPGRARAVREAVIKSL